MLSNLLKHFFISSLVTASCFASIDSGNSDCANINLYESSPIIKNMPVEDQTKYGSLGICYASAGSQLANFALKNRNENQKVHPIWLAYVYRNEMDRGSLESGGIKWSLDKLQSTYNCPYNVVEQVLLNLKKNFEIVLIKNGVSGDVINKMMHENWASYLVRVIDLADKIYTTATTPPSYNEQKNYSYSTDAEIVSRINLPSIHITKEIIRKSLVKFHEELCYSLGVNGQCNVDSNNVFESFVDLIFNSFKNFKDVTVLGNIVFVKGYSQVKFIENLLGPYCLPYKDAKVSFKITRSIFDQKNFVNKTLQSGYPVGFSFDLHSIYDFYSRFSFHSLLIIGSRQKNNSCQYLLRNSWGDQVLYMNDGLECLCIINGKYQANCTLTSIQNQSALNTAKIQGCWYDRDQLFQGSNYLTLSESVR